MFDYGASHFFVAASSVDVLGLEVETLAELLHVSFSLGTRVRIDQICRDCELEISGNSAHGGSSGNGHIRF